MLAKYLVYIDILGFEELAEDIARKTEQESRKIRMDFLNVLSRRIDHLTSSNKIIGKKYGDSDDWILVVEGIENALSVCAHVLDHNTGFKKYPRIPLEIAVGTGEFDRWATLEGKQLVCEDSGIRFIKSRLFPIHKKYYKLRHGKTPRETFILLSQSAYHALEPLDRSSN